MVAWGWGWLETAERLQRGTRKLGGGEHFHYLDCGDGFMVCTYVKTPQVVHFKCAHFIECQLDFHQALKKGVCCFPCATKSSKTHLFKRQLNPSPRPFTTVVIESGEM